MSSSFWLLAIGSHAKYKIGCSRGWSSEVNQQLDGFYCASKFPHSILALCSSFGVKQCQNWQVVQSQKLVKVVLHAQQQLLILWSDILTMKCTPANFIGHLWAKSSIEITFHRSQKDICPIWVGFFKQSIGILWLLYQVLHVIKWFLGLNNWNGPAIPSRFGFVQKTSICKQPCLKST